MVLGVAVASAVLIGFLAGLLTFRAKQRWCPSCGTTLACATGCTLEMTGHAPTAAPR